MKNTTSKIVINSFSVGTVHILDTCRWFILLFRHWLLEVHLIFCYENCFFVFLIFLCLFVSSFWIVSPSALTLSIVIFVFGYFTRKTIFFRIPGALRILSTKLYFGLVCGVNIFKFDAIFVFPVLVFYL